MQMDEAEQRRNAFEAEKVEILETLQKAEERLEAEVALRILFEQKINKLFVANKETVQEKAHLHTKHERLAAELTELEGEKGALRDDWQ